MEFHVPRRHVRDRCVGAGAATGAVVFSGLAVLLYVALLVAWVTVAMHTVRGVASGRLLAG
ncbi:hypothetical protein [Mycolicibacterium smegmatis]|uniref:hypothetical protein n=1 Tax=Mycolicibacterium smegmatis TaxID=1772 RepID=UPI002E26485B